MKNIKLFKVTIQLVSFVVIALVAYLIATNSFLAPDDSEASKLETLWMYDFDNLDDWDVVTTDGCVIAPHDMSSLGGPSKGLQISREVATKNCHLEKQIVPALTRGEIRIEFYDDLDANNPLSTVFAAKDANNNKTQLGIIAKQNSTEYLYNINGSDTSSNVARTQGWHTFTLIIDSGISYGSIDGVDLTYLPLNTLMTNFDVIKIASGWESKQTMNIGSVEVLSKSNSTVPPGGTPVPVERPSVTYTLNSTRLTPDQEFDIDITTTVDLQLLDNNELNNLFLNLGELYPDVSNLDYLPMFLVEKDPNGNYLFAGLSWKGTDNLGNPNINQYTSYEISGAKVTSGQDAWICNDTNRKTDFGFRDNTFACLIGSGTSVSQEGDKVAIRWSIRLMPGFFDLREIARGISKNSTNIRDLNVYTTVNRKSTDFTSEDFDFNNEWDKVGNVEIYNSARKNLNVSNFNYDQGSNMINVGLTGIDSSENINRITIWIDEIDPNGIRSDMASTFQFVKEGTEWKAYGRNYTDLRLICTVGQKTYVGGDCYRNYKYDFGGYALGSNSEIYYGRNRMSTGNYDANESSSKLSLSNTQITAANNSLSLQLPIEFYEIMMDRNLNMYISWISTDGNNMHWNKVGEMFVESNNSSDLGQVYIDNNQKLRYTGNDEEYTWVGTNDYLLHKYLDERELDAHMAKMHVYGMNYIRIFVEPFYTNPDSVMAFVD
ncbi:hypothetical protein KC909_05950, partial [Candidatus Dojkabacteria bacterium]|nr:hypothetical protein [Candidatus Dojkabacteria bacterium]